MATSQCLLNYKMKEIDIKVPNIGDFTDVEVIEVLVNEGQDILKNDPLITIESDKSSVEIPSNFEGKVKSLKLKVGDKVSEGDLILILESLSSESKIKKEIKIKASPRHVPAKIIQVLDIPKTKNGKLVELAVKQSVEGQTIKNLEALANPDSLQQFKNIKELNE